MHRVYTLTDALYMYIWHCMCQESFTENVYRIMGNSHEREHSQMVIHLQEKIV